MIKDTNLGSFTRLRFLRWLLAFFIFLPLSISSLDIFVFLRIFYYHMNRYDSRDWENFTWAFVWVILLCQKSKFHFHISVGPLPYFHMTKVISNRGLCIQGLKIQLETVLSNHMSHMTHRTLTRMGVHIFPV